MKWALVEREDNGGKHATLLGLGFLAAGMIVALGVIGFLVGTMWQPSTQLSNETGKLFLQAVFVVAVGAVVAFFVEALRERRANRAEALRKAREETEAEEATRIQKAERERDNALITLNEFIDKLDTAYVGVKRTRRLLQVRAKPDLSGSIERDAYLEAMLDLNEQQIDLEQLNRDADMHVDRLRELGAVAEAVGKMEKYVKSIWDESARRYASAPEQIPVDSLQELAGFLTSVHGNEAGVQRRLAPTFWRFVGPYRRARAALIRAKSDWRVKPASDVPVVHSSPASEASPTGR